MAALSFPKSNYNAGVRDLGNGQTIGEPIESAYGDFSFSPCSDYLFWIWRDENARPAKVFRRKVGEADDVLVYEEPDDGMFLSVVCAEDFPQISATDISREAEGRFIATVMFETRMKPCAFWPRGTKATASRPERLYRLPHPVAARTRTIASRAMPAAGH